MKSCIYMWKMAKESEICSTFRVTFPTLSSSYPRLHRREYCAITPLPQKGTPMPAEHVFAAEKEEEEGAIAAFNPLRRRAAPLRPLGK